MFQLAFFTGDYPGIDPFRKAHLVYYFATIQDITILHFSSRSLLPICKAAEVYPTRSSPLHPPGPIVRLQRTDIPPSDSFDLSADFSTAPGPRQVSYRPT